MRDNVAKPIDLPVDTPENGVARANPDGRVSVFASSDITLRYIWDRRQILFRWTAYGLVISILIAFLIPRKFDSTARLMPPDQMNSGMAMLAAAASGRFGSELGSSNSSTGLGSIAGDLLGLKSSGQLFVGVLQSRTIQDDLINKFHLRRVYWDRYMEDARKDLSEETEVSEDRKSGIVTIRVTDRNPQRAAGMAQEYVSELNRVVILLNTSAAHREREFLEGRLVQVKQDLESAENDFSGFASKNTALDIPTQGKAMIEASAALEGQLIGAQTELESLRQIYTDGNVRVRAAQARVDELRHQLEKIGGKFDVAGQTSGPDTASMYPSIRQLPVLGVKFADLYRNTKVQEAIFATLTQENELAKVQEAKETPSIKVLDYPNVPEKKSFPPRMLIIFLGTMLAISLCIAWICATAYWAEIDSSEPHKVLALEISHATLAQFPWGHGNGSTNGHTNGHGRSRYSEKQEDANRHE